ncbi:MAG TPA: serine/threonine-protein kinase, partial [Planctomycetota bacterium]
MVEVPPISPNPDGFTNGEPRWVGKYRILEVLGEGGMGVVYLAEERGAVQRRVALKLVKGGNDGESMIRRFEMERRALAVMEHENIAKVFFAGTSDEGRPYFVMEYVIGVPVTEYCNKQCLGVRERIELFLPICAGVQHAHHKGVIHRDIKPSNVLVAVQDGAPLPKIIDFGLARAADDVIHKLNDCTRPGAVVGTPDYMSPEQAGVNNLDIDTRTDIYSLGAVLYELLTGARPFRLGGLRNVDRIDEVLRIIHQDDPPTPSSRVASNDEAVPSMPIDKRALRRCLRGDLDWITMKALAKDRTQRYQNASELATDLRR